MIPYNLDLNKNILILIDYFENLIIPFILKYCITIDKTIL